MKNKVLIVLYTKDLKQTWCAYYGGLEEASSDIALMIEEGFVERGRIWAEEKYTFGNINNEDDK
jgi:hypothetical protein